jgi:hypothetical protein
MNPDILKTILLSVALGGVVLYILASIADIHREHSKRNDDALEAAKRKRRAQKYIEEKSERYKRQGR